MPDSPGVLEQKYNIPQLVDKFPPEIRDRTLYFTLSTIEKGSKHQTYEVLRNASRLCKKYFGNKEIGKLSSDTGTQMYIRRSTEFEKFFGARGITFGALYLLEIEMPMDSSLSIHLGRALSMSNIIHLNLQCGGYPEFILDISHLEWTMALKRLRILRIKLLLQNDGDGYPWDHSLWVPTLSSCTSLEVFSLKTPLPVFDANNDNDTDYAMETIVERWAEQMPLLQRIYVLHGYDEEADIGDTWYIGSNQLFRLKRPLGIPITPFSPTKWTAINIRSESSTACLPLEGCRSIPVLEEDIDPYHNDAE
ncbi:hypothetical protein GALMADRAFT_144233 [Galerina marginata CBS 339.88]|uniref:Uncharacterized protein n=1 Tax=Galerina marginata (strain CBS 339.88) TaxID=685588 RepID=A0A067SWM6_GALM3|nr:hypothetical protein GALMADRAFT_144233 [Galerina marginata CBS 339.88]